MSFCSLTRFLRRFLLGSLSLALVGCVEVEEKYTLNPDGSGKFAITHIVDIKRMKSLGSSPAPKPTDHDLEDLISDAVVSAQGVDVWAEANGKVLPDGRWEIKLQGYFKSFNAFRLLSNHPRFVLVALQRDGMIPPVELTDMKLVASGSELNILPVGARFTTAAMKLVKDETKNPPTKSTPAPPVSPKHQARLDESKPKLVGSKLTAFYNFGQGEIASAETFTRINPHTAKIEVDFSYMAEHGLPARTAILSSSGDFRQTDIITYANCPFPAGKAAKGPPSLIVKTKGPAFPYAEESAKAKAAQSPALKKLVQKQAEAHPTILELLNKTLEKAKAPPGKK